MLDESLLMQEADRQPPHKIDENMWKNREHMEEILFLLERSHWPAVVRFILLCTETCFVKFLAYLCSTHCIAVGSCQQHY